MAGRSKFKSDKQTSEKKNASCHVELWEHRPERAKGKYSKPKGQDKQKSAQTGKTK